MSDTIEPAKKAARRTPNPFLVDDARSVLLAKLRKAGPKGTVSLYPASAPPPKRAVFEEALAALESAREVFRDTRKAKPRFYLWSDRPELPTAEAVAAKLEPFAVARFPVLAALKDFAAAVKSSREEKALTAQAVALLVATKRLARVLLSSKTVTRELYLATEPLTREAPSPLVPPSPSPLVPSSVRAAYRRLAERTGFPDVPVSALREESAAPLEALKPWLLAEHQAGRAVLSLGDWSLADRARRDAALELHGDRYLLVKLLA